MGDDQPARMDHHRRHRAGRQNGAVDDRDLKSERPDEAWLDQAFAEAGRPDHRRGVPGQGRIEHGQRCAGHSCGWPQVFAGSSGTPAGTAGTSPQERVKVIALLVSTDALRTCVVRPLRSAGRPGGAGSASAPAAALRRLPDGHPDLQGLWLKSAGGFQGLFIGSLDGTNLAAGGRGGGGEGAARAAVRRRAPPRDTSTPRRPKPRERTVCGADTKIPRRAAICPGFRVPSISPPGFTRCRSSRTRSTSRCSTKPCTTSASSPPTTARIRRTTGPGTETRAAAGKATRWSSTSATSTAEPGWTWPEFRRRERTRRRAIHAGRCRHDPL